MNLGKIVNAGFADLIKEHRLEFRAQSSNWREEVVSLCGKRYSLDFLFENIANDLNIVFRQLDVDHSEAGIDEVNCIFLLQELGCATSRARDFSRERNSEKLVNEIAERLFEKRQALLNLAPDTIERAKRHQMEHFKKTIVENS